MMNFLRKHMRIIFAITILGFFAGIFVGFGSYLFGGQKYAGTAVVVNGHQVSTKIFNSRYNIALSTLERNQTSPEIMKELRAHVLNSLIQEELLWQKSKEYGILVSEDEVALSIQKEPLFANPKGGFSPESYFYFLRSIHVTPKEFEEYRKQQIAGEKLKILIASSIKLSDSEYKDLSTNSSVASNKDIYFQEKINDLLNKWFVKVLAESDIKITLPEAQ